MNVTAGRWTLVVVFAGLLAGLGGCGNESARYAGIAGASARPAPGAEYEGVARVQTRAALVPGEELWVIARDERAAPAETPRAAEPAAGGGDEVPGCGAMMARTPRDAADADPVPLPLRHTDVDAAISGYIASVTVAQQYHNPFDTKIEAVYVFPLPESSAVTDFVMTIGERRIRGIIREREQAERIYYRARSEGHVASLLTQERPNVFTQKVANIEPGHRIDVEMTYFSTLGYRDGWYEFVFPMVVGPRFNPPGFAEGVGAVARGAAGRSGQATEVPYLRPGERSGHDIAVDVSIAAGVPLEGLECNSHLVETSPLSSSQVAVSLSPRDSIPNKDFVLRYKVAGQTPRASLVATPGDERGGYFTLMMYPPEELDDTVRGPIEMVFVVDCSGSMKGEPIAKARRAIERVLLQLDPMDTFQVIRFSNTASTLGPQPLAATRENVQQGLRFVRSLEADGGTMMINGIRTALNFPTDGERPRYVTFVTDGYIGNEAEIIGEIERRLGSARIFSFGVGSSPNRYLMERMARVGRGVVAYVGLNDDPVRVMDDFVERIRHAALSNIEIDFGAMAVHDVFPRRLPDLFVGKPIVLTGRFRGAGEAVVRVRGQVGRESLEIPITVDLEQVEDNSRALPKVWARTQIAELSDRGTWDQDPELPDRIRQLALDHGLMSAYTAFVAVDSSRVTEGDHGVTVPVPVPAPDGVQYDTTVAGGG